MAMLNRICFRLGGVSNSPRLSCDTESPNPEADPRRPVSAREFIQAG
jgi:hypothetical protein